MRYRCKASYDVEDVRGGRWTVTFSIKAGEEVNAWPMDDGENYHMRKVKKPWETDTVGIKAFERLFEEVK